MDRHAAIECAPTHGSTSLCNVIRIMVLGTFAFPASFAQRRLWFIQQLEPNSPAYNVPLLLGLSGHLDVPALKQALGTIVDRHEALRTTFTLLNGEPVQVINDVALDLSFTDMGGATADEQAEQRERLTRAEVIRPFDLERGPLFRATLLRLNPQEHVLLLVIHHAVFDGWSAGVLRRELSECYRAYRSGESPRLADLPVQYGDFAVWQREWLKGKVLERQLAYWRTHLSGAPHVLELPTDYLRPDKQTYRGSSVTRMIPRHVLDGIRELSQREGTTAFMTLLAAFQILLARYTGQEDIVVGSPIANRTRSELEGLIGFFANSLPLRTDLSGDPSFRQLLARVREVALEAYAHQDLPFERLVEELQPERSPGRNPVFQVMFTLQNASAMSVKLIDIEVRRLPLKGRTSKFDLTLSLREGTRGLRARLEYNTDLFHSTTIMEMLGQYRTLLEGIVAEPDRRVSALPLAGTEEIRKVVVEWNRSAREPTVDRCVHALFEEKAAESPESIALEMGNIRLSYGELNARANRLARYLRQLGVGPEVGVGVAVDHSADLIVTLLAVLKAGGAYVPLDPQYPAERLGFMSEAAGLKVVVSKGQKNLQSFSATVATINLDSDHEPIGLESDQNPGIRVSAEALAYVMFTSGSTGRPKAIAIPHRAITRLVRNTNYVQLSSVDRVAQISNASFDASTFEIWGALLNGGRLVAIPREVVLSPSELGVQLRERGITAMFVTTALFNQLVSVQPDLFKTVRHVFFGGEAVDPRAVQEVLAHDPPQRLVHVYGPTECTTFATWHEVREVSDRAQTIPIGRPIGNTTTYVLDRELRPVAIGIPGELYLGGPGLARGYAGQPGLTADRFVPNPFSPDDGSETGARLYRTGDKVRWRSDGTLEFLGRLDEQIKLRGFRIEPFEIEMALARHPAVRECAVVVRDDLPGGRGLVAYLAGRRSNGTRQPPLDSLLPEIQAYLRQRLPEYMVPSSFVVVDGLPLSPNGKVARAALPVPAQVSVAPHTAFAPPSNPVERAVAELWQELLGIERVGIDDNFFESGGHSLLALKLFAEMERVFQQRLPLSTLFVAPTVRKLAHIICEPAERQTDDGLVMLQPGTKGPPLFVVHGADGGVMNYRELADRLGPDLPVYGLELTAGRTREPVLTTFEDLAAKYVRQMRTRQPAGPYFLCGHCWAGQLTFEMACQLRAAGQDVGLIALIDSWCPGRRPMPYYRRLGRQMRITRQLIAQNLRRLSTLESKHIPTFLRVRAENIVVRLIGTTAYRWSLRLQRPVLPLLRDHGRALAQAARCYRPPIYPGPITLFRARQPGKPPLGGATMGWDRVATGDVVVYDVLGEHLSIMREPQVEELARQLRVCLDRARASS